MAVLEMIFIPLLSFIFFIIFLHKWLSGALFSVQKNMPPSPRKLPIFGNLHQLGTSPHRSLQALSNLYGQLFLLHLGRMPVLVASSAQAAREIMKDQDAIFSNRPKSSIADRLLYGKDVGFTPYGEHWRQVRSICVIHLLSNKNVQSYRRVREEETSAMVEKIKQLGSSASVVNLSDVLVSLTNNIISRVALGRKHGEENNMGKVLRELNELLGTMCYGDHIPFLGWLIDRVNGLDAKVERVATELDEFLVKVIHEHRDEKRDDGDGGELDFVDILLEFQKENQSVSPVDDDTIKAIILDMFGAGNDTTSTALEWSVAELIKNPRSMKILQKQVRQVAGAKQVIDEDDLKKMPYLKAVIKESLRLHVPVPLLIPHESTQDTKVMGYDISAGTRVFINGWAIGRDPSLWENPEEFRPERFLDSSVDYKGLHFELVPFGAGRRGCPGIAFAEAIYELALAKLVHCFNFALPFGRREEDLDMSETSGLTVRKNRPLLVVTTF